jgi:hypothetical protein
MATLLGDTQFQAGLMAPCVTEVEKAKEKGPRDGAWAFLLLGERRLLFAAIARSFHIIVGRLDMGILC